MSCYTESQSRKHAAANYTSKRHHALPYLVHIQVFFLLAKLKETNFILPFRDRIVLDNYNPSFTSLAIKDDLICRISDVKIISVTWSKYAASASVHWGYISHPSDVTNVSFFKILSALFRGLHVCSLPSLVNSGMFASLNDKLA